ncbi:SET domain-containing protein 12 [Elsinoe australis]|uniref:SET domain-containing protein 12 n=1 Tax=Elsinoe australis TaxID=40998 RepID=A0A4U7AL64_9PEZI|nr:SET domain-containing protein 12 [Elsinoe australis]
MTSSLHNIQEIPGKGRGVIATVFIPKGTRIISEPPLFRVRREGSSKDLQKTILKKVASLDNEQQQQFFDLHDAFYDASDSYLGRVRTNALPLGSNSLEGGIFLESSRINHSCIQNAQHTWNEDLQRLTVHALRDISEGEEVTIFYLSDRPNHRARSEALFSSFRFTCSCSLCSLPDNERQKSDKNLDEIKRLDESIGDGITILSAPLQALHDVRKLLDLLSDEGIADASVPRAYYDAFQIAVMHSDLARGSMFAERAAATRVLVEGNDSPTVRKMQRFAEDPSNHPGYGYTEKWKTTTVDVRTVLDKGECEGWLWREVQVRDGHYADLRSEVAFPSFKNLPSDSGIDMRYFGTSDGFNYGPVKHWCFLGEIIDVQTFLRLRLVVKDKTNQRLIIAFHTDERGGELDLTLLQKGYTVAVLYAENHGFLDMTEGIRHEIPGNLKNNIPSLRGLALVRDVIEELRLFEPVLDAACSGIVIR